MNDDRDDSWSGLRTLRDQLRAALTAKQHANAGARLAPPTRPATGLRGGRATPAHEVEGDDGATDGTR